MPVSRPLGVANEASVASPSSLLSSILPASSIPLLPACVTFPDLAHCETFEDAINASNVYSQPNIAAKAAAEGRRLLEAGLGVDHTLVAAHVEHIAHNGLRHLLEKCSELLKHRTLQSVSKRRDPPSRGLQLFPVCPFPGADDSRSNEHVSKQAAETVAVQSSAPLSLAADVPIPSGLTVQGPRLQLPALLALDTPVVEPPDPQLYSNLSLFDSSLTRDQKFQLVAEHGAPILLRCDFVPNGCKGVNVLPPSIAPPAAIERGPLRQRTAQGPERHFTHAVSPRMLRR